MEELTLLYYLRIFSFFILFFLIIFFYLFYVKEIELNDNTLEIKKNQSLIKIINLNIKNSNYLETILFETYLSIHTRYLGNIHYGKFVFQKKINFIEFVSTISNPSNYILKITIVEGWNKSELNELLQSTFKEYNSIEYLNILADTYFLHSYENFDDFYNKLENIKKKFKRKYYNHDLLKTFTFDELIIIGSLLEKEGIDYLDKKLIFSVIQNRLQKNMKLQIDATTIFAITGGKFNLERNLNFDDLKIQHPYNTYYIKGLQPGPISYVGKKTMELIFENYKSNYLFYFYNNILKKHVYSETFTDHKRKLSDYRNKRIGKDLDKQLMKHLELLCINTELLQITGSTSQKLQLIESLRKINKKRKR